MMGPLDALRYRGKAATYVQAWTVETEDFSGLVYSQRIGLEKLGAAAGSMRSLTVVRHDNGDRELLPGTLAAAVWAARERPVPGWPDERER